MIYRFHNFLNESNVDNWEMFKFLCRDFADKWHLEWREEPQKVPLKLDGGRLYRIWVGYGQYSYHMISNSEYQFAINLEAFNVSNDNPSDLLDDIKEFVNRVRTNGGIVNIYHNNKKVVLLDILRNGFDKQFKIEDMKRYMNSWQIIYLP